MNTRGATIIDGEKCTGCGLCVTLCPEGTISMTAGRAEATGEKCFQCGHCLAVCPTGAIEVTAIEPDSLTFNSFDLAPGWLPWGKFDPASLMRLMASRRSCRNYSDRPVSRELLLDLVKAGTLAPSGTNSQKWTFTILEKRREVEELGSRLARFFEKINRLAANPAARFFSRIFSGDELGKYYREHYRSVEDGLREWRESGRDLLFHGAPAVIVVGSAPGASCPTEDALLATQNVLLAAHALGLGTCLIGYAVTPLQQEPSLGETLGIPPEEKVHAVIALGWPAETYQRLTGRKRPLVRFV